MLNSCDGSIGEVVVGAVLVESGVDLTGTEDDTIDFRWFSDRFAVFSVLDDPFEAGVSDEIFKW